MNFDNLHQILRSLYEQMMPLCGDMAGVAKGIAGLGALFYVAYRVWQSLARAEPIDVFPMLRPFAIGLCIMFFPTVVLGTINSIMSPVVQGTAKMLEAETLDMNRYREQKDKLEYEAMMRNPETAYHKKFLCQRQGIYHPRADRLRVFPRLGSSGCRPMGRAGRLSAS